MNFNEIEHRASNIKGSSVDIFNENEFNKNIIEILNVCISKNIKLNLSESDFVKVVNIYFCLGLKDVTFFKSIVKLNKKKLNFVKILDNMGK